MKDKHSFWFKASILSIAIDSTVSGVVSGAIPLLIKSFPNAPQSVVESISSLPSLAIMICVVLSPFVTKKIGYKRTVLLGLFISFLAGIAPAFISNIYGILASRLVFGAGIGLLNPLSYSIVAYFYDGNERSQMYGLIGTVSNLASVILTALVGILLQYSWHYSFLTYFVLLGILLLVHFILPEMDIQVTDKKDSERDSFKKMDHRVYYYAIIMFFLFLVFMTFNVKFGLLVTGKGYGSVSQATYLLSLTSIVGMGVGVIFGFIHKVLKTALLPVAMTGMALSYFLIAKSNHLFITAIGVVLLAMFFTFSTTSIFLRVSEVTPKSLNNAAASIELVVVNVGIFVSPYFMGTVGKMIGDSSPETILYICGAILVICVVVMVIGAGLQKKTQLNLQKS